MAVITERKNQDGSYSYQVKIRLKGQEIYKSFFTKKTAELYAFYKENLINDLKNFEVPIEQRLTIHDIIELKLKNEKINPRCQSQFMSSANIFSEHFGENKFLHQISFDDWLQFAKKLSKTVIYKGSKTLNNKTTLSLPSVRRHFAYFSSAISYIQSLGIPLANHPLKVIQIFITPNLKKGKNDEH